MKQASEFNMPDFLEAEKSCIKQLNQYGKKRYAHARFLWIAVITMVMICLCIMPINSLAKNIMQHIKTSLNLNHEAVALGNVKETSIRIPDDCEEVRFDGVTYLSKAYHALSDLTKDIQTDIYAWTGTDHFFDNGIMLNIVQNDYGRITLLYDITKNHIINKDIDNIDLQSVDMFIYFPLSPTTSLGDLSLENEQLKYGTIDDAGNIEAYQQNTEYELLEQFESDSLNTTITVISSKTDTKGIGDLGEIKDSNSMYYLYFTLEGMCYQINCVGTLDKAHDVIENIKMTHAAVTNNLLTLD